MPVTHNLAVVFLLSTNNMEHNPQLTDRLVLQTSGTLISSFLILFAVTTKSPVRMQIPTGAFCPD